MIAAALLARSLPMDVPEPGKRGLQLEMAAETLKAGLMRESFRDQSAVFRRVAIRRRADVDPPPLAALLAADVDAHATAHFFGALFCCGGAAAGGASARAPGAAMASARARACACRASRTFRTSRSCF